MKDSIEQMLADADRAVEPPSPAIGLTDRIPVVVRRRRRRKLAVLTCFVAACGLWFVVPRAAPDQVKSLQAQADRHMELAARLEAEHPLISRSKHGARAATGSLRLEVDRAALGLIQEADRIANDPALRDTAAELYRQVQSELPPSIVTDVARQRLIKLRDRKES
jgi:hypothetical protein